MRLETERLVLRELVEQDVAAVIAYQGTPEYQRLRETAGHTLEDATALVAEFIAWQSERPRLRFQLAVSLKSNQRLIGTCGIRIEQLDQREATIGYELAPTYWGQGYATESAGVMLALGFNELGLQRIAAWCHVDNDGSIRVLEKIGMRREEGRSSDLEAVPERWRDHYRFGLSDAEWRSGADIGPSIALHSDQSNSLKD